MTLADTLSAAGTRVEILARGRELAPEVGRHAKILVMPRLQRSESVTIRLETRVLDEAHGSLEIEDRTGRRWIDVAEPLVHSHGTEPDPDASALIPVGVRWVAVGGAVGQGATIGDAVRHASDAARALASELAVWLPTA
ncbi:hypothetical protein FDZ84_34845 [Saccharopolyspora sp. ASAGF58]|nr:hypothetical protein FDZ84_34845 [Saccharopolyspora sp. ASAGF58]